MTRSIFAGLLGLFSIAAVGALPLACQSGGIGDPCIPEDEYEAAFAGFKVTEENIESRSFQCSTRICLVNHFQGRTSCPEGQQAPKFCTPNDPNKPGKDKGNCPDLVEGELKTTAMCVEADVFAPPCVPPAACSKPDDCPNKGACNNGKCVDTCPNGLACDANRKVCACNPATDRPGYSCVLSDPADAKSVSVLKSYVCHKPGNCQTAGVPGETNTGKDCCVPGTDTPTTSAVCGQCGTQKLKDPIKKSKRSAEQSVYCSCRCGTAEGAPAEDNFNFCECPTGFSCSEVRPAVGLGDPLITGKYCVKEDTEYKGDLVGECGSVTGEADLGICEGQKAAFME